MEAGMDHHLLVKEGDHTQILSLVCKYLGIKRSELLIKRNLELFARWAFCAQVQERRGDTVKIVVLDGYTENPGDLSWEALERLGDLTVYDRTSYVDAPLIRERIGDAQIAVVNKTPITKETIDQCENLRLIAVLATGLQCGGLWVCAAKMESPL